MSDFQCWEKLNCGEGQRGRHVEVVNCNSPNQAAREAARYFDDLEKCKERWADSDIDGTDRYIEVELTTGPCLFRVHCTVVREYKASVHFPPPWDHDAHDAERCGQAFGDEP